MTRVRTGWSDIGSTRARTPSDAVMRACAWVRRSAVVQEAGALDGDGQVAVAQVEPHVDAQLAQAVHDGEGVVLEPPAPFIDAVGEPEGHQVRVGRDVGPVDLDVIAGVGDHDQVVGADDVEHPARQLRSTGPAGEHHHRSREAQWSRPVILIPARVL